MKPRRWRTLITIAVGLSLLLGLAGVGIGVWDYHKINDDTSSLRASVKIANADNAVPATTIAAPTNGSTVSGVVNLDAKAIGPNVRSVDFVATKGDGQDVKLGTAGATLIGWILMWRSANLPNGTYQISSVGYDANGRSSRSASITVTVNNH